MKNLENSTTFAGRLDPRWKSAALIVAVVTAASLRTPTAAGIMFFFALVTALAARIPPWLYLKRTAALMPFLLFIGVSLPLLVTDGGTEWHIFYLTISAQGLRIAGLVALKTLTIATMTLIYFETTTVQDALQAAYRLRVPGLLVRLTLMTHRYLYLLADEMSRMHTALRLRGYRPGATLRDCRTLGHAAGALFVRGHERAERVGYAMRCRGFAGRFHSLAEFRTVPADIFVFVIIAAITTGIAVLDLFRQGIW